MGRVSRSASPDYPRCPKGIQSAPKRCSSAQGQGLGDRKSRMASEKPHTASLMVLRRVRFPVAKSVVSPGTEQRHCRALLQPSSLFHVSALAVWPHPAACDFIGRPYINPRPSQLEPPPPPPIFLPNTNTLSPLPFTPLSCRSN